MSRSRALLLAALPLAGLAAGCTASDVPPSTSSDSQVVVETTTPSEDVLPTPTGSRFSAFAAACSSSSVRLSTAGTTRAGATTQLRLRLTNAGATACSVSGVPVATVLAANGAALINGRPDLSLAPAGSGQPQARVLDKGAGVYFLVGYAPRSVKACRTAKVGAKVRVLLAGSSSPLTVAAATVACQVRVGPPY